MPHLERPDEVERVFIVAGGPSIAGQNTDRLKGHRIMAINSSWQRVPFAELLFFADDRWWREYSDQVISGFHGRIVTSAPTVSHSRGGEPLRRSDDCWQPIWLRRR